MSRQLARPIAIALLRNDDRILVSAVPDEVRGMTGWRPPGGTIEFGERGEDALCREIREELGAELSEIRYLDTLENIFTYLGDVGHELVRVYEARFADPGLYVRGSIEGIEDDSPFRCIWKPLSDFVAGEPLYPDGLLALLTRPEARR